jgi:hypothetical protein
MYAGLNHLSFDQYQNLIHAEDGVKPVGNDQGRPASQQPGQGLL